MPRKPKRRFFFPEADVAAARADAELQRKHPVEASATVQAELPTLQCRRCKRTGSDLAVFYFRSPEWTWQQLVGRAGFLVVCDHCPNHVAFFMRSMN